MIAVWKANLDQAGADFKESMLAGKSELADLHIGITESVRRNNASEKQITAAVDKTTEEILEAIDSRLSRWKDELSSDLDERFSAIHDRIFELECTVAQKADSLTINENAAGISSESKPSPRRTY
ncbi:hypothetical protein WAI453_011635 [Rhynchosporium graminicola]|uniref:Uncharacterized protein n=1 Tax=Rhynchosporium graminicola TaxID=2792576 RepID=A0A1E1LQU8_9HELO|nr:uncharacterized protein RCO7_07135 [Rhynchosporium commune]